MKHDKNIVAIVRKIVDNGGYKTNIKGCYHTIKHLTKKGYAFKDTAGVWLSKNILTKYLKLLVKNDFTEYELKLIENGPFGIIYFSNELQWPLL